MAVPCQGAVGARVGVPAVPMSVGFVAVVVGRFVMVVPVNGMARRFGGMHVEVVGFSAAAVIAHGFRGLGIRQSSIRLRAAGFLVLPAASIADHRSLDR